LHPVRSSEASLGTSWVHLGASWNKTLNKNEKTTKKPLFLFGFCTVLTKAENHQH